MTTLEFRLVILEDGKEVFAEPLSCELMRNVASNYPDKISSQGFFKYASMHPSFEVRQEVAYKDKLDEDSCRLLIEDNSTAVLKYILRNSMFKEIASIDDMEKIMKQDPELGQLIASGIEYYKLVDIQNLAERIVTHGDPSALLALAQNNRTPKKVLRKLAIHDDPLISCSAKENIK